VEFTVVFSEPVTGFATGDVTLGGTAGATTAEVTEVSPSDGTTYLVSVSGMTGDGTVVASIDAAVAKDLAGNDNEASTSTDNTVTYTVPTTDPLTAIADLRADVVALDLGRSESRLTGPLDRAANGYISGRMKVAISQMDNFIRSVDSLLSKGVLDQSEADDLKAQAAAIVTMLGS
jgi:hypothetical protein